MSGENRPGYRPSWMARSYATQIALASLAPAESRRIVAAVARSRALPDALVERVLAWAEGNPLFLEELTRSMLDASPAAAPAIPQRVRAVIAARIEHLCRYLLRPPLALERLTESSDDSTGRKDFAFASVWNDTFYATRRQEHGHTLGASRLAESSIRSDELDLIAGFKPEKQARGELDGIARAEGVPPGRIVPRRPTRTLAPQARPPATVSPPFTTLPSGHRLVDQSIWRRELLPHQPSPC